jgi:hypothetical protein
MPPSVYGLIGWQVLNSDGSGSDEKGVLEGMVDSVAGAVDLDLAAYVDYATDSDYSMRIELSGDTTSHTFDIRLFKYTPDGYQISIIGSGVSKGEGQYFLFKVKDNGDLSSYTDGRYFCYEASLVGHEYLKTKAEAGYIGESTVDPDCEIYKDSVDGREFFETSDVPVADNDFNPGIADYEGTIYISGID